MSIKLSRGRAWLVGTPLLILLGLFVALAAAGPAAAHGSGGSQPVTCDQVEYPVTAKGNAYVLKGTRCRPKGWVTPRAAVLLVHGQTYDRTYFDFPFQSWKYSTARNLAADGYLTVAIDRLGSGSSSRPPTDGVLADAGSEALQGVVKELSKAITTSGKVFAAGHSAGSSLIIRAAAAYGDLDGIVVTGFLHATGSGGGLYGPATQPAGDDPKFKGDVSVPTGYVTTRAGVRPLFYYPWNADEWVVEKDDLTKDATSGVDPGGVADERTNGTYAKQLKVPVLTIIGQRDLLFCTPPLCPEAQREASFYPLSPSVETIVRPRTGHSIALHDNAEATNDKLADWLDKKTRPYRPWDR